MTVTTNHPGPATTPAETAQGSTDPVEAAAATLVEDDLLVEDVSIDGMCGVY